MKYFISVAAVLALVALAIAAVTFSLSGTAGVRTWPAGITDAKFPGPPVARDELVPQLLVFDAVNLDVASTPSAPKWRTWKCALRADRIVRIEQGQDEFTEYLRIGLIEPPFENPMLFDEFSLYVRGDLDRVVAIVARVTGTRRVDATFDEAR